jgi:DNA polymerase elongation subunit (family B)
MYQNRLIYGKNSLERIVSIEINEDVATIFRELPDGSLDIQKHPNKFWILASKQFGPGWVKLEGDQAFKYGRQYKQYDDWQADKKNLPYTETFTISNVVEQFMVKDGFSYYKGCRHDEISILSFDIETTGLEHNDDSKVILITNTFRKLGKIERRLFSCDDYTNCAEMIDAWAEWVQTIDPSIIVAHNGYAYDLPYLKFCHSKHSDGNIRLGRLNKPIYFNKWESKFRVDGSRDLHYNKCQIYGREFVDTMFLAYKYDLARKYESYGLKKIIAQEGLEKKDRQFYDASKIRENYTNPEEMVKIKAYAEEDADDALTLYDLMAPTMFYLCPIVPKPFQLVVESATGSQINSVMVRAYLQDKHSIARASAAVDYEGAISFAVPGIYSNMFKIDFSQLYPSIMMQYEVYDEEKDPKAFFKQIVKFFADFRQKYKKLYKETGDKQYYYLEQVAKVVANSCYGFLGATGLAYNSPSKAAFITAKGRELLQFTIEWATSKKTEEWLEIFHEKTK